MISRSIGGATDTLPLSLTLLILLGVGCGHDGGDRPTRSEGAADPEVIQLTSKAVERSGIAVAEVGVGRLPEVIEAPAEIHFIPSKTAHISSLVSGHLSDVRVGRGQQVKAGDVLAVMSSIDLGEARARLAKAKALVDVASSEASRQKQLSEEGITAKRQLTEAEGRLREAQAEADAAKTYLSVFSAAGGAGAQMPLKSPIAGTVSSVEAIRGENVAADTKLFVVTDMSAVWAVGQVAEQDLAKVKVGQKAEVTLRAYRDKRWQGEIDFVPCELDESSRSLKVRVVLDNAGGELRRGLFGMLHIFAEVEVEGDAGAEDQVVTIPVDAVQKVDGRRVVFVPGEKADSFRVRQVTLGTESGERVEVRSGLDVGDSVVVEGAFILKSQLLRLGLGEGE